MKKSFFSFVLALVLCIPIAFFVGCGNESTETQLVDVILDTSKVQKTFQLDEEFNSTGLKVVEIYSDGSRIGFEDLFVDAVLFNSKYAGKYKIEVVFTDSLKRENKFDYEVEVVPPEAVVEEVEVEIVRSTLFQGEDVRKLLTVTAIDNYAENKIREDYVISGFDSDVVGEQNITISVDNASTSLKVEVLAQQDFADMLMSAVALETFAKDSIKVVANNDESNILYVEPNAMCIWSKDNKIWYKLSGDSIEVVTITPDRIKITSDITFSGDMFDFFGDGLFGFADSEEYEVENIKYENGQFIIKYSKDESNYVIYTIDYENNVIVKYLEHSEESETEGIIQYNVAFEMPDEKEGLVIEYLVEDLFVGQDPKSALKVCFDGVEIEDYILSGFRTDSFEKQSISIEYEDCVGKCSLRLKNDEDFVNLLSYYVENSYTKKRYSNVYMSQGNSYVWYIGEDIYYYKSGSYETWTKLEGKIMYITIKDADNVENQFLELPQGYSNLLDYALNFYNPFGYSEEKDYTFEFDKVNMQYSVTILDGEDSSKYVISATTGLYVEFLGVAVEYNVSEFNVPTIPSKN